MKMDGFLVVHDQKPPVIEAFHGSDETKRVHEADADPVGFCLDVLLSKCPHNAALSTCRRGLNEYWYARFKIHDSQRWLYPAKRPVPAHRQ